MRCTSVFIAFLATSLTFAQTETTEQTEQAEQTKQVISLEPPQAVVPQTPPTRPQGYSQNRMRVNSTAAISVKEEQNDLPNTIENQIGQLIEKSGNYQAYKVVEKAKMLLLQQNVLDTLKEKNNQIQTKEDSIAQHKEEINLLKNKIQALQDDLEKSEKQAFSLFGMNFTKGAYSTLLLGTIVALATLLVFYVFKFFESNAVTKTAKKTLAELQEEYEEHRARAIEREQKLRRELQDEINKNRGGF